MKKKDFLTEAKRKAIIADKEKTIIESFAKTFNKIKRVYENEVSQSTNMGDKKRKIVVLVGPPSVGKSTWTENNFPNAYVINRDDIVEKVASELKNLPLIDKNLYLEAAMSFDWYQHY